jgi:hypothetical protein
MVVLMMMTAITTTTITTGEMPSTRGGIIVAGNKEHD